CARNYGSSGYFDYW
nr:immunoglobulin heavy chain junction region [Mus musculus]